MSKLYRFFNQTLTQFTNEQEDGAKLVVSSVINTDADTYLCQINSEPPKKLYHSLEILGELEFPQSSAVVK